jgi:hypothetical protein
VDRRLVIACMTANGLRLLQRLNVHTDTEITECVGDLSPEELRNLLTGLEALHRAWSARQAAQSGVSDPEAC